MTDQHNPYTASSLEASVRDWARDRMSAARFAHTTGVVETVTRLARQHDLQHASALRLAGWIHDAAKEYDDAGLLAEAARLDWDISPVERAFPALLHGVVAVGHACEAFGIDNPVITSAVLYHTTGHPDMTPADKAFYLADLTEPTRQFSWVEQARALSAADLDRAMLFALVHQLRRLLKRGSVIDTNGIALYNRLLAAGVPLAPRER